MLLLVGLAILGIGALPTFTASSRAFSLAALSQEPQEAGNPGVLALRYDYWRSAVQPRSPVR